MPAMLLVTTRTRQRAASTGSACSPAEAGRKGQPVWRLFVEGFDRCWTPAAFGPYCPNMARDFVQFHGYGVDGEILLPADNDHHANHSDASVTHWHRGCIRARRSIAKGAELTNNYRGLDLAFYTAFLAPKNKTKKKKR